MSKLIEVTQSELSKVKDNMLNEDQVKFILKKTPKDHIYTRPAKGGGTWNYVTGVYVKKVLNLVFGWEWSFKVVEFKIDLVVGQAYVLGKLTVTSQGRKISKMQFGRVDIKFKSELVFDAEGNPVMIDNKYKPGQKKQKRQPSEKPLDVGNDLKAATTDALKKCAAELGICSDVYAPNEYKEIRIISKPKELSQAEQIEFINKLLDTEGLIITEDERMNYERIIDQKEYLSFDKAIIELQKKLPKNE